MPKVLKYLLIAFAILVALVVAAVAVISATFNPNDYKPQLIELVQKKTQRTLSIPGDIRLTFFPRLGAELGQIALTERKSAQVFASAEQVRVSVALLPLFSQQVVVDRLLVDGLSVQLLHRKDGSSNYGDLVPRTEGRATPAEPPAPDAPGSALRLDVGGIDIRNTRLSFSDEASQRKLAVSGLRLQTGPIAQGRSSHLEFAATLQGEQPRLALQLALASDFTPDLTRRHLTFDGLTASINGSVADLSDLQLKLGVPILDVSPILLKTAALTLDAALNQGGRRISARLSGAVQGDLTARHFDLERLNAELSMLNPAGGMLALKLGGKASADLAREAVQLALDGQLDSTTLNIRAGLKKFAQPAIDFDIALGELDADRYLPKNGKPATPTPAAPPGPEAELDLSPLQTLDARGTLKVAALKIMNLKATDIRLQLKAAGGRAELSPLSATLYGGHLKGGLSASAGQPQRLAGKLDLRGIHLGPLLKDAIDRNPIDGSGDVALDVGTTGARVSQFKRGLGGTASLALKDGAINGINLAAALRNVKAKLGGGASAPEQGATSAQEKTDFTELGASFRISKGVAHNDDLSAKTPLLRLGGSGDIFIAEDRLDYTLKATVVPSLQGQGGPELEQLKGLTIPVHLSGPYSDIGWKIDIASLAGQRAKELLDERKQQLKEEGQKKLDAEKARLKEQAEERLKNLLRR